MFDGLIVAGRYRLDRHAGSGGMGSVYRGVDIQTTEAVAIKLLPHDYDLRMFEREAMLRLRQAAQHERFAILPRQTIDLFIQDGLHLAQRRLGTGISGRTGHVASLQRLLTRSAACPVDGSTQRHAVGDLIQPSTHRLTSADGVRSPGQCQKRRLKSIFRRLRVAH